MARLTFVSPTRPLYSAEESLASYKNMAAVPYAFGYSSTTAVERQPLYAADVWLSISGLEPTADPLGAPSTHTLLPPPHQCRFLTIIPVFLDRVSPR
jgi:hypothetical protein